MNNITVKMLLMNLRILKNPIVMLVHVNIMSRT